MIHFYIWKSGCNSYVFRQFLKQLSKRFMLQSISIHWNFPSKCSLTLQKQIKIFPVIIHLEVLIGLFNLHQVDELFRISQQSNPEQFWSKRFGAKREFCFDIYVACVSAHLHNSYVFEHLGYTILIFHYTCIALTFSILFICSIWIKCP